MLGTIVSNACAGFPCVTGIKVNEGNIFFVLTTVPGPDRPRPNYNQFRPDYSSRLNTDQGGEAAKNRSRLSHRGPGPRFITERGYMNLVKLLDRPIAFHRAFARLAGSVHAGILLSQAVYWSGRTSDPAGWFYKTQAEWEEETCLSRREQETARGLLRRLMHQNAPLWREERRGVPARMFYQVNFEVLGGLLAGLQSGGNRQASMAESAKLACTNPPNWHGGNRQTITENTYIEYTETTPSFFGDRASREPKKKKGEPFRFDFSFLALSAMFTETEHAWLVEHCPTVETETACLAFLAYHQERATKFRSSRAVLAAWRGWMVRAEGRAGGTAKNATASRSGLNSGDVESLRLAGIID